MRKTFLLLLLCTSIDVVNAQVGFAITYERQNLENALRYPPQARLVFNDTVSYFYHIDPPRSSKTVDTNIVYGKNTHHHSWYHMPANKFLAEGSTIKKKSKPMLVFDTLTRADWIMLAGNTVKISGYDCSVALSVNKKNDSTFAYYTTQINYPFGPAWYYGLPGVILEVYDQAKGWSLTAIKVEQGQFNVALPDKFTLISREKYNKSLR